MSDSSDESTQIPANVIELLDLVKPIIADQSLSSDGVVHPMLVMLRDRQPKGFVLLRDYTDEVDKKTAFVEASLAARIAKADETTFSYGVTTENGTAVRIMGVNLHRAFLALLPYTIGERWLEWVVTDPIETELDSFDHYMVTSTLAALRNVDPTPTHFPMFTSLLDQRGHRVQWFEIPADKELQLYEASTIPE